MRRSLDRDPSFNCLEGKTPTVFVPLSTDRAEVAAPARSGVVDLPLVAVVQRVQDSGIAAANPAFAARSEVADTAGWRRARIVWNASYSDFGSVTHMDYYIRRVRGRTVVLLLMYTPGSQGKLTGDPLRLLDSFREKGEAKR